MADNVSEEIETQLTMEWAARAGSFPNETPPAAATRHDPCVFEAMWKIGTVPEKDFDSVKAVQCGILIESRLEKLSCIACRDQFLTPVFHCVKECSMKKNYCLVALQFRWDINRRKWVKT